jgi:hypothetical protein
MRSIEIEQDNAEHEVLECLIESDLLEGAALGIAKQVLSKGRESLSEKQEYVFQRFVADKYFKLECSRCHIPMPTSEVLIALMEDDGLCGWCRHMREKYY